MKAFINNLSRRTKLIIGGAAVLTVVLLLVAAAGRRGNGASAFQTDQIERGTLTATVGATGTVHARQSAILTWQVNGTVANVDAAVGDEVQGGDVLAVLDQTSVPQNVIAAQADLVTAQQALDDLLESDTARAQALIDLKKAQEDYDHAADYRESLNGKIDLQRVTFIFVGGRQIPQIKYYKGYASPENIADADDDVALKKAKLEDAAAVLTIASRTGRTAPTWPLQKPAWKPLRPP